MDNSGFLPTSCRVQSICRALLCVLLATFSPFAMAEYQLNLTPGVTKVSNDIYTLHMVILWVCIAIAIVVFGVMMYAIVMHRKSRGHTAHPFHESTVVEIIWTLIPFAILIAMAFPATHVLKEMSDTSKSDITIKVTGYRWYWHYDYLDEDFGFFSYPSTPDTEVKNRAPKNQHYLLEVDEPVVVPVGKKVRFLTTGHDVIHSWWVPALGVKKDAIPGFLNSTWAKIEKPGTYRGQCAELCGAKHGYMPIVVEAKTEEEYREWVNTKKAAIAAKNQEANKKWTKEELMEKGEKIYTTVCAMCHQANGQGIPPTFPSLKGSPIVTNPDRIKDHIHNVLFGKNAMPALGAQMSDVDVAAVITFERNSWGNNTGQVVQPEDVKAERPK